MNPYCAVTGKSIGGGALIIENAEKCSVNGCYLHDIGGNAIFFSNYNRNHRVSQNHITRIGASAVCFVGSPDAVRSPLFEYGKSQTWEQMDKGTGPLTPDYPSDCLVDDNLIHSIGEIEKQGAGIQLSMSARITIRNNSIYDLPRAGINVSEGTWGGHLIEGNDVFDTVLETGDHGSFNSWGRDRYWHPDRNVMDEFAKEHPQWYSGTLPKRLSSATTAGGATMDGTSIWTTVLPTITSTTTSAYTED